MSQHPTIQSFYCRIVLLDIHKIKLTDKILQVGLSKESKGSEEVAILRWSYICLSRTELAFKIYRENYFFVFYKYPQMIYHLGIIIKVYLRIVSSVAALRLVRMYIYKNRYWNALSKFRFTISINMLPYSQQSLILQWKQQERVSNQYKIATNALPGYQMF